MILLICPLYAEVKCEGSVSENEYSLPEGFSRAEDYIDDVIVDIRYFSDRNFTGGTVDGYERNTAILTTEACTALKKAADELRDMGFRIKIWDAYRPLRAVRAFVKWAEDPLLDDTRSEYYPEISSKQLLLDREYIARNSNHCKGSCVDMTLTDLDGNELDMGTGFDYFGKKAWHGAGGLTDEQEKNRSILKTVMEKYGFKCFQREWWHYRLRNQPFDKSFDFIVR